jgi:apolipoprotein N-acyltransferase
LSYFVAVALAAALHRRLGARHGVYGFAAAVVVLGWLQYELTPGSSWGVLAHTQADRLPFVQLAALGGLGAMTFLVALGSSLAAAAWLAGVRAVRADLAIWAGAVVLALLWGQWRLGQAEGGPLLRVGAVVSPVTHDDFRAATHDVAVLRALDEELFARSARAADLGARVVVWNEVATMIDRADEAAFAARAGAFARERGVVLVAAYGVAETMKPFWYANKYRLILPDGTLADEYVKRHPVPGDPHGAGSPHARVVDFAGARLSGAICYDFGFPGIARDLARDGATLAQLPSSDWRGIDPEHGLMARTNAVAVGLPMVRPVRAATSIVTDAHGRVLGSLRADSATRGVLVADVVAARVPTAYARIGEVVPLAALAYLACAAVFALRRRR